MSAQGQKPIDFAMEGLRLALPVERNWGIRDEFEWARNTAVVSSMYFDELCSTIPNLEP
jgi:hypothetical protein